MSLLSVFTIAVVQLLLFRLWLWLGGQISRKQNERMSNKSNAKLRRHHQTLSLPMLRHPQHLLHQVLAVLQQVQQPHSYHPSHGGLRSYFSSAVHIHHVPMAINTVSVTAFGYHSFTFTFSDFTLLSSDLSVHQPYFLVVRLVQWIGHVNANCCERMMVRYLFYLVFSPPTLTASHIQFCGHHYIPQLI
jgi:hypothetical protein